MHKARMRRYYVGQFLWLWLPVAFLPLQLDAALLYLDPAETSVHRGDTIAMAIRLDTDEGECVNAADVVIKHDPSIRAVDVSRGNSILSLWVEDPVIDAAAGTISFAGGIPGGYCGRIPGDPRLTNILAEIIFRVPGLSIGSGGDVTASIQIDEVSQVLQHDQFGTRAPLRREGATLHILSTAGSGVVDEWAARIAEDNNPPADFTVTLGKDDAAFSGKYFITFNTQDKQSGIDHYEVMEEPFEDFNLFRWGRADAPWVPVQSPYVLEDQSLNSTIRVKAIDKAGNETISVLVPDEALRSISMATVLTVAGAILLVALLLGTAGYVLWRRKQDLIRSYGSYDA